jgi:hypothetical protein
MASVAEIPFSLLAPARDDQQRVVNRDAEPDEGDEVLDQVVHRDHLLESEHEQEGREDRGKRHQQRHDGDRGPVHECEDDERAERSDQRLDQHARAGACAAPGRLKRLEPSHGHRRASWSCRPQRGLDALEHASPEWDVGIGHVDQRPRRSAVARDELRVVGRREVGHAEVPRAIGRGERAGRDRPARGLLHALPCRQAQHGDGRLLVSVQAETLADVLVGFGARGSRRCDRVREGSRGGRGGYAAGDGQQDPTQKHEAPVMQSEPGGLCHGRHARRPHRPRHRPRERTCFGP